MLGRMSEAQRRDESSTSLFAHLPAAQGHQALAAE
jgi:hypothetical protein